MIWVDYLNRFKDLIFPNITSIHFEVRLIRSGMSGEKWRGCQGCYDSVSSLSRSADAAEKVLLSSTAMGCAVLWSLYTRRGGCWVDTSIVANFASNENAWVIDETDDRYWALLLVVEVALPLLFVLVIRRVFLCRMVLLWWVAVVIGVVECWCVTLASVVQICGVYNDTKL